MPSVASNAEEAIVLGAGNDDAGVARVDSYRRFNLLALRGVVAGRHVNISPDSVSVNGNRQ